VPFIVKQEKDALRVIEKLPNMANPLNNICGFEDLPENHGNLI
jgi:hypothetical protein